jgi:IS1 family transposase
VSVSGSKKHWSGLRPKVKKTLVWFGAKGQKHIGLVWGQRSKKHWSGLRPKVKKTLVWFEAKGQKNIGLV